MAWRRTGDKPLSEPMIPRLPTHKCVTRPQWVNESIGQALKRKLLRCPLLYGRIVIPNHRLSIAAAPVFSSAWQPQNYNATEGEDYVFNCKADAEPAAEIQWMINGEPIDRE